MSQELTTTYEDYPEYLPTLVALNTTSVTGVDAYSDDELCKFFQLEIEELEYFKGLTSFRKEVQETIISLSQDNESARMRSRRMVDGFLESYVAHWLDSKEFPPSDKVKLLKLVMEYSEGASAKKAAKQLEEKAKSNAAPAFIINLQQAPAAPAPTIEVIEVVETKQDTVITKEL